MGDGKASQVVEGDQHRQVLPKGRGATTLSKRWLPYNPEPSLSLSGDSPALD